MIELTLEDDRKLYVNPFQVVTVGTTAQGKTAIGFPAIGDEVIIKEPALEAAELFRNWFRRTF